MDEPTTDKKFSTKSTHTQSQLKAIIEFHPLIRFSGRTESRLKSGLLDESERHFSKMEITANLPTVETYGSITLKIITRASVERAYIMPGCYESIKRLKKDFYGLVRKVETAYRRNKTLKFKRLEYIEKPS